LAEKKKNQKDAKNGPEKPAPGRSHLKTQKEGEAKFSQGEEKGGEGKEI